MIKIIEAAIEAIDSDRLVACLLRKNNRLWVQANAHLPLVWYHESQNMFLGESMYDKDVLIIDEYCDYGEEIALAAQQIHKAGARNIYLAVEHSNPNNIFSPYIQQIFILDNCD